MVYVDDSDDEAYPPTHLAHFHLGNNTDHREKAAATRKQSEPDLYNNHNDYYHKPLSGKQSAPELRNSNTGLKGTVV